MSNNKKWFDDTVGRWRDEKGRFTKKPEVKDISKDTLIDKSKYDVIKTPKTIKGKEEKPAFYQDESGRWRTRETVKINDKEYNKGSFIPHKHDDKYERYNEAIHNKNQIKEQADIENVPFESKLEDWYMMKKAYRSMQWHDDIYYDGEHIRDRETDEIIPKDDLPLEVHELAEIGLLDEDIEERYEKYVDYRIDAVGS